MRSDKNVTIMVQLARPAARRLSLSAQLAQE